MSKAKNTVRDDPESVTRIKDLQFCGADAGAINHLVSLMALHAKNWTVTIEEYCAALSIRDEIKGTAAIEGSPFMLLAHASLLMELGDRDGKPLSHPSCVTTMIANAVPMMAKMLDVDVDLFAGRIVRGIQSRVMAEKTMTADETAAPN